MAKCILDHCEFACGGQCALVCPKGLGARTGKQEAAKEIENFVRMLTRIKIARYGKQQPTEAGVCRSKGVYHCYISYNRKQHYLGVYKSKEEAANVRADAERARELCCFDEWLKKHRAKVGIGNRGKRTQKKKVP